MKNQYICVFCLLFVGIVGVELNAASDSVHVINSFFRQDNSIEAFTTTSNGDTLSIVYSAHVRTGNNNMSLTHLQVRNWNSRTGNSIRTHNFYHLQSADEAPNYKIGTLNGTPHLVYCPQVNTLNIVNAVDGSLLREFSVSDTIRNIYMSPDFTHAVVCTLNDQYYVVDLMLGKVVLKDTVWNAYNYVTPPDTAHGLPDSSYFRAYFKIHCRAESWSPDNSLVMLRVDRISDTVGTDLQFRFESYWRPYDLSTQTYLADSVDMAKYGHWLPDSKLFARYSGRNCYLTLADLSRVTIQSADYISDFGVSGDGKFLTLISPTYVYSIWDLTTKTLVKSFSPGPTLGYCFNSDRSLFAYMSTDTVLTVINVKTLQGIFQLHIPFIADVAYNDVSAMNFLYGDRAILIRDVSGTYKILDLATTKVVATIDKNSAHSTSPDGTSLFLIPDKINRYDLFTGNMIKAFPDNDLLQRQQCISLSPDAHRLCSLDDSVRVWDVNSTSVLQSKRMPFAYRVLWTPLDSILLVFHDNGTSRWTSVVNTYSLQTIYQLDSTLAWLSLCADDQSQLVCSASGMLYKYLLNSGTIVDSISTTHIISAATENPENSLYVIGDTLGSIWKVNATNHHSTSLFEAHSPIRKLVLSPGSLFLSFISADHNDLLRVADGMRVQKLLTATKETLFCQKDSTCVCIYDDALIRFTSRSGSINQVPTASRAYFRPQKNYYAVGSPDARDSLALFDFFNLKASTTLHNVPTNSEIIWSTNASTLATIDLFNNIVIWTPANLKQGEIKVSVESESAVDYGVHIFPLPVRTVLRIGHEDDRQIATVRLTDMVGHSFTADALSADSFDTSSLSNGCYGLDIVWNDGQHSYQSLVLNR